MPEREPLLQTAEEVAENAGYDRWFGAWAPLDPPRLAEFMAGFERPWWIVGGWAIEAFTGVLREHEDVDLSILACDVPALRAHVGDALEPVEHGRRHDASAERHVPRGAQRREPDLGPPRPHSTRGSSTCRSPRTATGCGPTSATPTTCVPLEEATWVAADGIRYLRPEITLLYKAVLHRPKDDRDLAVTWPLLPPARQAWLRAALERLYPGTPVAGAHVTPYAGTRCHDRLPRPRRDHADAAGGRRGDDGAPRRRRQRQLAARLRAARAPGRGGVARDHRAGPQLPARRGGLHLRAAPSPTTSRSRASSGRAGPPTRAGPASSPPRSSTTPSSTRCYWLAEAEGAEVELLPVDARGRLDVDGAARRGRARPRVGRAGLGDVGQQRGRHPPAGRRGGRDRGRATASRCTPTPCRRSARCRSTSRRPASTR